MKRVLATTASGERVWIDMPEHLLAQIEKIVATHRAENFVDLKAIDFVVTKDPRGFYKFEVASYKKG